MAKVEKELTIGKFITLIVANLGLISVIATMAWVTYADPLVRASSKDEIEQWKKDSLTIIVNREIVKRGGFRSEIRHELIKHGYNVDKSDVPRMFVDAYVWTDSLKLFDRAIKPMLINELKMHDVGLKVNKFTMDVEYLHTDGRTYFPSYDGTSGKWYILKNGVTSWCQ